jgi:hypothetical protein
LIAGCPSCGFPHEHERCATNPSSNTYCQELAMSTSQPVGRRTLSPRWQFSLLTLLIAMTWVGLVCVALCNPGALWTGLIFVLAVGSLLVASLCIVYRDGRARAFAVGFVIFGTTYLFVSMGDTPDVAEAHTQLPTTRWGIALYSLLHGDKVQSSTAVGPIYPAPMRYSAPLPISALPPPPAGMTIQRVVMTTATPTDPAAGTGSDAAAAGSTPVTAPAFVPVTTYMTRTTTQPLVSLASFLEVVHQVLVILLGVIGGIVAQILYSTRREQPALQQPAA